MNKSIEELETIIRRRVCGVCTDRKVDGECGLENPDKCALFSLFPEVAKAVLATDSNDIQDYINAIREHVCTLCGEQMLDGSCETRNQVQCALDAYLILVVDAIEEATGKEFDRTKLTASPTIQLN